MNKLPHLLRNFGTLILCLIAMAVTAGDNQHLEIRQYYKLPAGVTPADYEAQVINLKLLPESRFILNYGSSSNAQVQKVLDQLQVLSLDRTFKNAIPPESPFSSWGEPMIDLTLIYQLKYKSNIDIETAINSLLHARVFQYVEPNFIPKEHFTPNDPSFGLSGQYFIKKIKADSAWDVIKGDTNVVIGIVDSGTDPNHPDLVNNIKYNYADPINGIDDDADGYIDNFRGWDLSGTQYSNGDPDPTVGVDGHGSHVSGCAAASTNNGIGVASPGYLCKFLPVKAAYDNSGSSINFGYQGVVYAADHGCQIINCSWGSTSYSDFGKDIINYASVNKQALVCASAGNNGNQDPEYPSAYPHALSVAATTSTDAKASFSSYGTWVGISAPGQSIYSTYYNDTYLSQNGTSMSSPICAGAAGVVKAKFPSYIGEQIKEQLRATADNIDANNIFYVGKLGAGRVNLYRAVTSTAAKSVTLINIVSTDNNDDAFVIGDTVRIKGDVINWLNPLSNLNVAMSSTSPYITLLNTTVNVGALGTMSTFPVTGNPFSLIVKPTAPANSVVALTFTFTDGAYSTKLTYEIVVNVDYLNIAVNDVATTATSKSLMAWNDSLRTQGLGFVYRDSMILFECGLMVGTSNTSVSDDIRGANGSTPETDFRNVAAIKRVNGSPYADFDAYGSFDDATAVSPLNILVNHRDLAWSSAGDRKYVIVEYRIKNKGANALNNFYAGMFADWDISNRGQTDQGNVDKTLKLGYALNTSPGGFWAGIKLLTNGPFNHYAIDNDGSTGGINIYDGYPDSEKYLTLTTSRDASHLNAGGGDCSEVVSTGPFTVASNDSVVVAFALIAGDNLNDIQNSARNAQVKYDGLIGVKELVSKNDALKFSLITNPVHEVAQFRITTEKTSEIILTLYNIAGQQVATLLDQSITAGTHVLTKAVSDLDAGVYFYSFNDGTEKISGQMVIIK